MLYIYYLDVNHTKREAWIHQEDYQEWIHEIKPLVIYQKTLIN